MIKREVFVLDAAGSRLVGTCHHPPDSCPWRSDIGILQLNPGYLPRSARGDLGAHLADELAARGFPAFRFDMPALGDSPGELPAEVLEFFAHIQTEGHVACFNALKNELLHRFGLEGIVFLGHCGGATTAVYAAARCPDPRIRALVLLDPSFIWYRPPPDPPATAGRGGRWAFSARRHLANVWQGVRRRVLSTAVGGLLSAIYARLKQALRRLQGKSLPADTNVRLFRCWERLLEKRTPLLAVTAGSPRGSGDGFDYLASLDQAYPDRMTRENIPGTSHSFVEGNGRTEVVHRVGEWLCNRFVDPGNGHPAAVQEFAGK